MAWFLLESLILPFKNPTLFLLIILLTFVLLYGVELLDILAIAPLQDAIDRDSATVAALDPHDPDFYELTQVILQDEAYLGALSSLYHVLTAVVPVAVRLVVFCATVATCSGEKLTPAELLKKVKASFSGLMTTLACVYAVEALYDGLIGIPVSLLEPLEVSSDEFIVNWLIEYGPFLSFTFFAVVLLVAAVSSVGAGATGDGIFALKQAWQIVAAAQLETWTLILFQILLMIGRSRLFVMFADLCLVQCELPAETLVVAVTVLGDVFTYSAVTVIYFSSKQSVPAAATGDLYRPLIAVRNSSDNAAGSS